MGGCSVVFVSFFLIIIFLIIFLGILTLILALTALFFILGIFLRKKGKKIGYLFLALGVLFILFIGYLAFSIFGPNEENIETPTSTEAVESVDLDLDLENTEQTLVKDIKCEESPQITQVSVSMICNELIDKTTRIENTYGIDILSTGVVGLVGVPVDISTTSSFDEATITFTYDDDLLGDTKEEDLRIMRYYGQNSRYVILDKETVLDTNNNTLSVTTSRFATYLVVDRQKWYDAWK